MFGGSREQTTEDIEDGFFRVRLFSLFQFLAGFLGILCGIVSLNYGWPNLHPPIRVGAGIWTGLIVVASASCGIASTCMIISLYNRHIKRLIVAQWILALISLPTTCLYIGLSAWVYVACSGNGNFPDWCYPNNHENVHAAIANMAAGSIMFVLTFPVAFLFCCIMPLYDDLSPDFEEY